MTKRLQIRIQGAVQGVGFRPFIYRLAGERFDQKKTGTVFADLETTVGLRLEDLLALE